MRPGQAMTGLIGGAGLWIVMILASSSHAWAQPDEASASAGDARVRSAVVHRVRPGETLASIAQRYYGDPRRESILVAENGLAAGGGAPIVVGLRLMVPWSAHHRIAEGETWSVLAERFYGDASRVGVILDANQASIGDRPDVGAEIIVPYPLRHVVGQGETVTRLAANYYGSTSSARRLMRFNGLRGNRLARGQIVLIPLSDLTLSEEGRRLVEAQLGPLPATGEARSRQLEIDEALPRLRAHVIEGRYAEALALGNRLLGSDVLTGNQQVSIQRELATAYVALDREDLAIAAFRRALSRQADLQLDAVQTSPVVMRAFRAAQMAHRAAQ